MGVGCKGGKSRARFEALRGLVTNETTQRNLPGRKEHRENSKKRWGPGLGGKSDGAGHTGRGFIIVYFSIRDVWGYPTVAYITWVCFVCGF